MVEAMQRAQDDGGLHGLGMNVDDCQKTYEELAAKGVEFLQKPEERPYGIEALCRDNSGNWMVLVEPREYTPKASPEPLLAARPAGRGPQLRTVRGALGRTLRGLRAVQTGEIAAGGAWRSSGRGAVSGAFVRPWERSH